MKVFIEHRGSKRHPWICLLAETSDEKIVLEKLYWEAQSEDGGYVIENNLEWQQNGFKLMFVLQVEQGP